MYFHINKRIINADGFVVRENGSVECLTKPENYPDTMAEQATGENKASVLRRKDRMGMVPYAQALLLARTIRNDLDAYPPFLWK